MKKYSVIFQILMIGCVASCQSLKEKDVPQPAKDQFKSMYSDVEKVSWEMENGNYEAEFHENGKEMSVQFTASGMYVEMEREIPVDSLPQTVRDYMNKNFAGKKISEASIVTKAAGDITYEAEMGGMNYVFDPDGNFIKKESD